jgi:hypothetical protein
MKKISIVFALLTLITLVCYLSLFLPSVAAQAPPASNSAYVYISTATTTTVRGNAGFLDTVTINGGTAGVVTLYDIGSAGCTGTPASGKFATIETISATNPVSLIYNLQTKNGICVVTAAATDLTVTYN